MARLYVQAQKFQISGSGISSSATSLNLVSFKITKPDASTRDITMADFGDLGLMVLDPGVARKEETISFTGVTQNGDGSATLTGVTRGITPFSPYGADASYASAHSGFVTAILSNPAKMYSNFIGPTDDVTVTGLWNFPYPTTSTSPATKQYVDDVLSGAIGTATDTTAGSTKMTRNQSSKPRAVSTIVREQDTPNMTLKVDAFKLAFIDSLVTFAGGNSPAFINPGFGGDLGIVSNPSNTETVTLTINGTVCTFTFVTSIGAAPGNILIQGTAALTRAALATFIANPGTTNANQVAFAGAQLTALGLISSTDDLSANLFIRATSATVTTFTGAETMAGGSNTWTANTTKNRLDLLVLNGGSLAIRRGSEAVSPVVPTPTSGDTVLCSVYNIPGETVIRDRTAALSGYIDQWYDLSVYRTDLVTTSALKTTDVQTFTTPGTTSWTKPAGAVWVEVVLFGGGGAGGSGTAGNNASAGAGGGYSRKSFRASSLGATETVVVGAAGVAGANNTAGGAGGFSAFGTTVLLRAEGGNGGSGSATISGGSAYGDIRYPGGNSGSTYASAGLSTATDPSPRAGGNGGYNGGAPATATAGGNGGGFTTSYVKAGGTGGAAGVNAGVAATTTSIGLLYGGAGGGGGGYNGNGTNTGGNGGAGGFPGGGGGGSSGTNNVGGNGADGAVVVITYF